MVNPDAPVLLSVADIAQRAGVDPATIRSYLANARKARTKAKAAGKPELKSWFPEPNVEIDGRTWRWTVGSVEEWENARPGPGARTDLPPRPDPADGTEPKTSTEPEN